MVTSLGSLRDRWTFFYFIFLSRTQHPPVPVCSCSSLPFPCFQCWWRCALTSCVWSRSSCFSQTTGFLSVLWFRSNWDVTNRLKLLNMLKSNIRRNLGLRLTSTLNTILSRMCFSGRYVLMLQSLCWRFTYLSLCQVRQQETRPFFPSASLFILKRVSVTERVPIQPNVLLCSKLCSSVQSSACSALLDIFVPPINHAFTSCWQK